MPHELRLFEPAGSTSLGFAMVLLGLCPGPQRRRCVQHNASPLIDLDSDFMDTDQIWIDPTDHSPKHVVDSLQAINVAKHFAKIFDSFPCDTEGEKHRFDGRLDQFSARPLGEIRYVLLDYIRRSPVRILNQRRPRQRVLRDSHRHHHVGSRMEFSLLRRRSAPSISFKRPVSLARSRVASA